MPRKEVHQEWYSVSEYVRKLEYVRQVGGFGLNETARGANLEFNQKKIKDPMAKNGDVSKKKWI